MRRTLLIADDSVTIRRVVELTFLDSDIGVEAAATGEEAMERLARIKPDLVLADVVMPGPTGYEICRAVKASVRPVPVLLLAGTFEPFDSARAKECGADGHLVKPFDSKTLVARVEELLSKGPAASPPRAIASEGPAPSPVTDPALESLIEALDAAPTEVAPLDRRSVRTVPSATRLTDEDVERVTRAVISQLSDAAIREIAWEVVPDLAEAIVRERIRQLERGDAEVG